MRSGTLKQILLITDGCSNSGENPVAVAALAKEQGIVVNVIGVVEEGLLNDKARKEIEYIADSGGGISQFVYATQLSKTVQMVTKQAMTQTLQGVINQELKHILGRSTSFDQLPPEQRGEIVEVVEELEETTDLEILILVDVSASMKPSLETVKEALIDLSISLRSRTGKNSFSILLFPGKRKNVEVIQKWSNELDSLTQIFSHLSAGGITPTGPALKEAVRTFRQKRNRKGAQFDGPSYLEETV